MTLTQRAPRTLESLRTELQARIGAAAGIAFAKPLLDSFLIGAQEALYILVPWKHLRTTAQIPLANGSAWYDLPEDCNIERIGLVAIQRSGVWEPLHEGIELRHRNFETAGPPTRYDIQWNAQAPTGWNVQMEVHPVPALDGALRIEYTKALLPFSGDNDVATIPTGPLFLHALTNAKLHYRQPDGPQYAKQLEAMLSELRGRHRRVATIGPRGQRMLDEDLPYLRTPLDYPGR